MQNLVYIVNPKNQTIKPMERLDYFQNVRLPEDRTKKEALWIGVIEEESESNDELSILTHGVFLKQKGRVEIAFQGNIEECQIARNQIYEELELPKTVFYSREEAEEQLSVLNTSRKNTSRTTLITD